MNLLNVRYDNVTFEEALARAVFLANGEKKANLFFLNADCLYRAQRDKAYRDLLNTSDLILPDGIGLKLVTACFSGRMKANCNGSDFSPVFIKKLAEEGRRIYFLGAKDGVAARAAEALRRRIPGVQIVGTRSGYFGDDEEVIRAVNSSGAEVLFVAMGVPQQEKWISKNRQKLNVKLCLGVGALFDYLSGNVPRAPQWMRQIHLEWFWRILVEPRRLAKRYLVNGSKLFWIVLKERLTQSSTRK